MTVPFMESPRFPDEVAFWARGGPSYNTTVVTLNSGYEQRNINWSVGVCHFDIQDGLRTLQNAQSTISFFRAAKGMGYGFRFKDYQDYQDAASGVLNTNGYGNGTPVYQMYKNYVSGSLTDQRKIVKPVVNTVVPTRDGNAVTYGTAAGNASLDTTTGLITFVADASSTASSITPGTQTVVVLATNPGSLALNQLLYLNGFAGANANLVNGIAHSIYNVTGTGPYTFMLATNTSGATITVGSGTGYKYPQASEPLAWTGQFDVPMRFNVDLANQMGVDPSGALFTMGAIPLVEIRM